MGLFFLSLPFLILDFLGLIGRGMGATMGAAPYHARLGLGEITFLIVAYGVPIALNIRGAYKAEDRVALIACCFGIALFTLLAFIFTPLGQAL